MINDRQEDFIALLNQPDHAAGGGGGSGGQSQQPAALPPQVQAPGQGGGPGIRMSAEQPGVAYIELTPEERDAVERVSVC